MDFGDLAQWVMTVLIVVGLIMTWARNGRSQNSKFTEVKTIVTGIKKDLDDKNSGLGALNEKIGTISTENAVLNERVSGHDREIKEIKASKRRRAT